MYSRHVISFLNYVFGMKRLSNYLSMSDLKIHEVVLVYLKKYFSKRRIRQKDICVVGGSQGNGADQGGGVQITIFLIPLKTCDKFMPSLKVICKKSLSLGLENNLEDIKTC